MYEESAAEQAATAQKKKKPTVYAVRRPIMSISGSKKAKSTIVAPHAVRNEHHATTPTERARGDSSAFMANARRRSPRRPQAAWCALRRVARDARASGPAAR